MKKNKKALAPASATSEFNYFPLAFGVDSDDLTTIPTTATSDNSVSYQNGWTLPYEENQEIVETALDIPRGQMNQLFYQITQAIQQIQQYGYPFWITSAENLSTPFPYPINATVYYNGLLYQNQIANNIATPGEDNSWLLISGSSTGNLPGMITQWAGPVAPSGWAICDGSALLRASYPQLFTNITQTQSGVLTNASNAVTGLTSTDGMYAGMSVEADNIPSGTLIASITNSTAITLSNTATASSTSTITFFYWGNGDGSTTFNIPNKQDRVSAGCGGTSYEGYNGLGQVYGNSTHTLTVPEIPNHQHLPDSAEGANSFMGFGVSGAGNFYGGTNKANVVSYTGGILGYPSEQIAFSITQPTQFNYFIIRLI